IGRHDLLPSVPPSFPQPNRTDVDALDPQHTSVRAADLPVGARRNVELAADEPSLQDMNERERVDQYLDWLLFTAVAGLRPSPEEYSKIFFDLPPSRAGYMRPVGSFEFGETRSRLIGDGQVLALIPAGRSPAQRKDFLASIADEHRKNQ